mgnify:CR=1 FL=1
MSQETQNTTDNIMLGREEEIISTEKNKAIVRRLFEELNERNSDVFYELFAPDFFNHHPALGTGPDREGLKEAISGVHKTFPDCRWIVEDMITAGNKVVYRFTMHGTNTVGFMGMPPTGKKVILEAIGIQRFSKGKVVERWNISDQLGLLQQLGLA